MTSRCVLTTKQYLQSYSLSTSEKTQNAKSGR